MVLAGQWPGACHLRAAALTSGAPVARVERNSPRLTGRRWRMRLVTVLEDGQQRAAALVEQNVVDLQRADPRLPSTVVGLLRGVPAALERARELVQTPSPEATKPRSAVRLLAPIPRPPKIVCIGVNYADHAAEAGRGLPPKPSVFLKAPSCVIGPGEPIVRPPTTEQLDYEVEFSVVIGRTGKNISRDRAM